MGELSRALPAGLERHLAALRPGLDMLTLPACLLDRELRYRYANQAYADYFGLSREHFLGLTADEAFRRTPRDSRRGYMDRALEGEPVIFHRETLEGPNAGKWLRAHYLPLHAEQGEVVGVMVVLIDVQPLREAETRLQLVIDNIGVPLAYIDRDLVMRFANRPGLDWNVANPEEAIGKRLDQVFDVETLEMVMPEVRRALAGERRTYERLARTIEGQPRWVRVHLIPDVAATGVVNGLYTLMIDVDEDYRLRERLEREEARTRFFLENIPGSVSVIDGEFRYLYANGNFKVARGLADAEDVTGRHVRDILGERDFDRYIVPAIDRLQRGETCTYERLVEFGNGAQRWRLVRLVPMLDARGTFGGFYSLGTDINDLKVAQERMREQETQLRLYTDNIPDSVAYLDRGRRILFANRHFAEQRGTMPERVIGKTTAELMGRETADWIANRTQPVFDRGEEVTYEREILLPSGARRWFHVKAVPDVDASGVVRGMYVVSHDIHEVKQAQERLAAKEEELRFFAENIPEAIVYIDLEKGCTFVNNTFLATRGFTREYALGKFPAEVYPPEVMRELEPHIAAAMNGHDTSYERRLRLPSGRERWVRVRLTPRKDAAGTVRGFYVLSTDIDEIKGAQAAIEDKERQLRQVIDSVPTPMCFVDARGRYRYVNDAFLEYAGKRSTEVLGATLAEVLGEDRASSLDPILERVRHGESVSMERPIRFADGRTRWMIVRRVPRIVDGEFLGHYAITSDIHEQKMVEDELRRANSILSAHFDNTPLAVIEYDTELRVVRWSGRAEPVFGWSAAEMLGRSFLGGHVYEEDEPAFDAMIRSLASGEVPHASAVARNYRKDGSVIWVEWHNSALRDEAGKVISILSLAQDVSSRM